MSLDLYPPQGESVERAIERLLGEGEPPIDPWWAEGLADALGSDDGLAAQDAWGGAGVVEP
jgi:hypothetical protein